MLIRTIPLLVVVLMLAVGLRAMAEQAQPNSPVAIAAPTQGTQHDRQGLTHLAQRLADGAATPVAPAPSLPSEIDAELAEREKRPLPVPGSLTTDTRDRATSSGAGSGVLQTIFALAAVVGLILLLRLGMAKLTGRAVATSRSSALEVLGRINVAPRSHVLILRFGNRILAVGESQAGLRTLAQLDDGEEVAQLLQVIAADQPTSVTRGFSQLMKRFSGEYDDTKHDEEGGDDQEFTVDRARDQVSRLMARLRGLGASEKERPT